MRLLGAIAPQIIPTGQSIPGSDEAGGRARNVPGRVEGAGTEVVGVLLRLHGSSMGGAVSGARFGPHVMVAWILSLLFFVAGVTKLLAVGQMVQSFEVWGVPPVGMYFVGVIELVGAFLLIPASTRLSGAALSMLAMMVAFSVHLLHQEVLLALLSVLVAFMAAYVAYQERKGGAVSGVAR